MSAHVLVLGGDGMLGRMIRIYLAAVPGFSVDWTSRRQDSGSLTFNAESPETLFDLANARGGYDFAVNCIAVLRTDSNAQSAEESEAYRINAVFPHQLAKITAEIGCKLVHVSTDAVFAPTAGRCAESDVPEPADNYGRMKLLGEPAAPNTITLRCSIVGPNPIKKLGLFEWVLGQSHGAKIKGYTDQLWSGVTTLQFAKLCRDLFQQDCFTKLRTESAIHHFCPNEPLTKYDLLQLLCRRFRPDIQIERASGGVVNRVLEMGGLLRKMYGPSQPIRIAIDELSTYIDGPKTLWG